MVTETQHPMTQQRIHDVEDALTYMTECTLATVSSLADKANPPKGELRRQISIAQTGIDYVKSFLPAGKRCGCGRVEDIISRGITVEDWAKGKTE